MLRYDLSSEIGKHYEIIIARSEETFCSQSDSFSDYLLNMMVASKGVNDALGKRNVGLLIDAIRNGHIQK